MIFKSHSYNCSNCDNSDNSNRKHVNKDIVENDNQEIKAIKIMIMKKADRNGDGNDNNSYKGSSDSICMNINKK